MNILFWKKDSQKELIKLVKHLEPELNKYNYNYETASKGHHSLGAYANGFFIGSKAKIGLILRQGKLGSVNYEGADTNISHDQIFEYLKETASQRLLYEPAKFQSYTSNGEAIEEALLFDLKNFVLPFIDHTSESELNSLMLKIREENWNG